MKRGTPDHPKVKRLAEILKLKRFQVVGVLESLWHFAASYAKRGDIGKWPDADIAAAIEWDGNPAALVAALVECRLLDRCQKHRLVIHDWAAHADQTVGRSQEVKDAGFAELVPIESQPMLANASEQLANASQPLPLPCHSQSHRPDAGSKPASAALAEPSKPKRPKPEPVAIPECLNCEAFKAAWADWQAHRREARKPLTPSTERQQLANLADMGADRAVASIRQSIGNGWQGLFAPKADESRELSDDEAYRRVEDAAVASVKAGRL